MNKQQLLGCLSKISTQQRNQQHRSRASAQDYVNPARTGEKERFRHNFSNLLKELQAVSMPFI